MVRMSKVGMIKWSHPLETYVWGKLTGTGCLVCGMFHCPTRFRVSFNLEKEGVCLWSIGISVIWNDTRLEHEYFCGQWNASLKFRRFRLLLEKNKNPENQFIWQDNWKQLTSWYRYCPLNTPLYIEFEAFFWQTTSTFLFIMDLNSYLYRLGF